MERSFGRTSACCMWHTWSLVCDPLRGLSLTSFVTEAYVSELDYWFLWWFLLLWVPQKATINFFAGWESMSAASVGFGKRQQRQLGQMLSGAMGMHVLHSWSLGNSWKLLPVASGIHWLIWKFSPDGHVEQETLSYWIWTVNLEKNSRSMRQKSKMPICLSLLQSPTFPSCLGWVLFASCGVFWKDWSKSSNFYFGGFFFSSTSCSFSVISPV